MERIYKELVSLSESNMYPFHMPGHKRGKQDFVNPFKIDITEIEGFDNLHNASGILNEAMKNAAKIYGADRSFFLVNGSTCGILAAIESVTKHGEKIIVSRNCHKAVYHAIFLGELEPVYIVPDMIEGYLVSGGISPEKIDELLENDKDIKVVVITSPTYDGVVSDIEAIAKVVHKYNIPLIVDEAHGAHFKFSKKFPISALDLGADIVIQSLHKTLPSLTQTAILHIKSQYIDENNIETALNIFESSSPSYVFMASIDECIRYMQSEGQVKMVLFAKQLLEFRHSLSAVLKRGKFRLLDSEVIGLADIYSLDRSKIIIGTFDTNMSGKELYDILVTEYDIQPEMSSENYVTLLTSIADTKDGFDKLEYAMSDIVKKYIEKNTKTCDDKCDISLSVARNVNIPEIKCSIYSAMKSSKESIFIKDAIGKISAEFVYVYPPGIPIITPGEKISFEIADMIYNFKRLQIGIEGLKDKTIQQITVVKEG
jgi:Arginine/lysine/ornithine decarboxylases